MGRIKIDPGKPFAKSKDFLVNANKNFPDVRLLQKYGQLGVDSLRYYTPKLTGKTSESWYYEIIKDDKGITIYWNNKNIVLSNNSYISVAVLLQNGYTSIYGNWIEARDYITPALTPIIEALNKELEKEAKSL